MRYVLFVAIAALACTGKCQTPEEIKSFVIKAWQASISQYEQEIADGKIDCEAKIKAAKATAEVDLRDAKKQRPSKARGTAIGNATMLVDAISKALDAFASGEYGTAFTFIKRCDPIPEDAARSLEILALKKSSLERAKRGAVQAGAIIAHPATSELYIEDGMYGTVPTMKCVQVIDGSTAIVKYASPRSFSVYWLIGYDTKKLVDGENFEIESPVLAAGTKRYESVGGSVRTVRVLLFADAPAIIKAHIASMK